MKLSICIATFNRASFLPETLATIVPRLREDVELVVVDGASADDTAAVMAEHSGNPYVQYLREPVNSGVDADYDKAVGYARGEFVWLAADDDLILPGAIDRVLTVLAERDPDVVVVDAEVRDVTLNSTLDRCRLPFSGQRYYSAAESDRLLADAGNALSFIGGTIIRRARWMERDRRSYFGSLFIHVGVIFQAPMPRGAVVMGEPLVAIRLGNAMWSPRSFDIWARKWPDLIWRLPLSATAKRAVVRREPGRHSAFLVLMRANGALGLAELSDAPHAPIARLIARLPGRATNALALGWLTLRGLGGGSGAYNLVRASRFSNPVSRAIARATGASWARR